MSNIFLGDGTEMATEHDWGTTCLTDFVQELADEITGSCMIPMHLPAAEVENIIKRARKWFYKKYEYSVQENFFVIPKATFDSTYFKASRTINMPDEVYSIFGVHKTNASSLSGDVNFTEGDFSIERMFAGNMYGNAGTAGSAEALVSFMSVTRFSTASETAWSNLFFSACRCSLLL